MFCVAPGLAATTHPTGVLGAVSSPAVEASGAAPLVYLTTYTLRISTNRVKSAEVPTNVKEVVARFATEIHANHLEAFHTSLRRRCAAYRRRTNMYAKETGRLQERLDVYWIVHNFVRVHFTTRRVPAVALGILDHGFALHELFLIQKAA